MKYDFTEYLLFGLLAVMLIMLVVVFGLMITHNNAKDNFSYRITIGTGRSQAAYYCNAYELTESKLILLDVQAREILPSPNIASITVHYPNSVTVEAKR